jgi:hypothetical protein
VTGFLLIAFEDEKRRRFGAAATVTLTRRGPIFIFASLASDLARVGLIVSSRVQFVGTAARLSDLSLPLASFRVVRLVLSPLFSVRHIPLMRVDDIVLWTVVPSVLK